MISKNQTDAFVCKTDTNGNVIWAKRFGGPYPDYGTGLDLDSNDNIYISGRFQDTLIFDNDTLSSSFRDMFFGKLNSNGNLIWMKHAINSGTSEANCISVLTDEDGFSYLVGNFSGSATFGLFNINSATTKICF